jgi:ankyrin repeat protein
MWATRPGDTQSLRLLLEYGADPNLKTVGLCTALHYAVGYGNEASVRLLLEYGASPDVPDSQGMQPLHWLHAGASQETQVGKIEALIQYGADVNARAAYGTTPLCMLTRGRGFHLSLVDSVRYLIEMGADVDAEDDNGLRPVEYAIPENNVPLARYLLDIGAELRLQPPRVKCSLLHAAAMAAGIEIWSIIENLLREGFFSDIEGCLTDASGHTPWDYFEKRRYQCLYGDLQNFETEKEKFLELMDAVERAISTRPVNLFSSFTPTAT